MKNVRLLLLSALFLLLLNEPIISIVSDAELIGGIPVLYLYVLLVWALLIGMLAYMIHRSSLPDNSLSDDE